MSLIGRTVARIIPLVLDTLPKSTTSRCSLIGTKAVTRSFNCLSSSTIKLSQTRVPCFCGCNGRHVHTKGDKELVEFLTHEIAGEKKNLVSGIPTKLDDFSIKADRSQLILTRKFNGEEITVTLDVNHTVDAESPAQVSGEGDEVELKSRPSFEVDVKKGNQVLSFTCSFMTPGEGHEGQAQTQGQDVVEDVFGINEITIYEGEWAEETYCVSGDILDQNLYDLLLNYLEERGISEDFAEKLSNTCSEYEHSLYYGLLQKMQDFVKKD